MQHCVVNQDEDISVTWLLLHNGSIVDYTCNLVFNARCISSTGPERRLNYFRTVHVVNNETKWFEMFWATSFRFRLIISARFRYSKIVQTFWCIVIFHLNRMEARHARQVWSNGADRRAWGEGNSRSLVIGERARSTGNRRCAELLATLIARAVFSIQ